MHNALTRDMPDTDFDAHRAFEAVLGFVPSIVVGCEANGTIAFVGGAVIASLGYDATSVIGHHFTEFVHVDNMDRTVNGVTRWQGRKGAPIGSVVQLRHVDGDYRSFHFATRFGDDVFGPGSFVVTLTPSEIDSSVNETISALIANEERVARIASTFLDLAADDIDAGLNAALEELSGLNAVTRISVWLVDRDQIMLTAKWQAPIGAPTVALPDELRIDLSAMVRLLLSGSEFRLTIPGDCSDEYSLEREAFESGGVKSVLAVPIMTRGKVVGFLGLESTLEDVGFDVTHMTSTRSASAIIAAALDRQDTEAELARQARTDPTTGLSNRWYATSDLQRQLDQIESGESPGIGIAMVDLDRFKLVNEALGHHVGDELLREVASRFASAADAGVTLARLSADDFLVVVPDASDVNALITQVQALLATLTAPFALGDSITAVTATGGLAYIGDDRESVPSAQEALRRLESTLDQAKKIGSHFEVDDGADDRHLQRLRRISELQHGIERGELVPYFQAEWDIATSTIIGAEALVRWQHPTEGLIGAYEIVTLAESAQLVSRLGAVMLRSATTLALPWLSDNPDFLLHVNVSAQQLRNEAFATEVAAVLEETGYPATSLCLELTESMLLDDPTRSGEQFNRLRALGVGLAIDDFGTGYSSVLQLKELPLTSLKIDQRFVAGLGDDPSDRAIVDATLELARAFGVTTTAEGVETDTQRQVLIELGCRRAQGYLFSKPEPAEDFAVRIASNQ